LQTPEQIAQPLTLFTAATHYLSLGWSVIPLRSDHDPARPKAASVSWERFQTHLASEQAVKGWFGTTQYAALGIVTGLVSGLWVALLTLRSLPLAIQKAVKAAS